MGTAVRKDSVWAGLVTGVLEDVQLLEQVRGCRGFEETVWLGMGDQRAWAEVWGPGMTCLLAKPVVWIGWFRLKLHSGGCLFGGVFQAWGMVQTVTPCLAGAGRAFWRKCSW